jgi:hypothetical protein
MTTAPPPDDPSDWSWIEDDSDWIPPDIDTDRASPARMYDFALGGKDNFAVDRLAVERVAELVPEFRAVAVANRGFLVRSVGAMCEAGIDQFIDIGTGLPTSPNVHEIAGQLRPGSKVVYVDNDPIVMAHNRALRTDAPGVLPIFADLRRPDSILHNRQVREHLDFGRPIGLLFVAVLHFIRKDVAPDLVARYRRELPPGSYVAISTAASDGMSEALITRLEDVYSGAAAPMVMRTREEVEQLFEDVDLIDPGLTDVTRWRSQGTPLGIRILSGAGPVR